MTAPTSKLPPGPYRYSSIPVAILDAKGDVVAKIDTSRYDNWDDVAALGHLLAAAPELLEALDLAVQTIEQLIPEPSARGVADVVLFAARAALSKSRVEGG